jgi:DNA-binding FadR family transcriptional regulator
VNDLHLRRVQRVSEQVHEQIRSTILRGEVPNGGRLPSETELAAGFGVSRGTVREALRPLAGEGLIKTVRGSRGGSFVTLPTVDHVSATLGRNIELLSLTEEVTLPEFLEARELIEVFAVRQATARGTTEDIEALRATLVPEDSDLVAEDQYLQNRQFHQVLIQASNNTLLRIASEPIYSVLHTHLTRSSLDLEFPRAVCRDHRRILEAIESGDADRAGDEMVKHLESLATVYRRIWRLPAEGRG